VGQVIQHRQAATPYEPLSLAEKRSHLEELRMQAMFCDSDLLARRIRDLEAQIEQETGRRLGDRRPAQHAPRLVGARLPRAAGPDAA
jgi:hypothetical protein